MEQLPSISLQFLGEILGKKVESFTIREGSKLGDNFTSILFSFAVKLASDEPANSEFVHFLSKCFPRHPTRQEFLKNSNIFWNELSVYKLFIPELEIIFKKIEEVDKLPFPPFVGGKAINFEKLKEMEDTSYIEKVYEPFENFIMMSDMRETLGFRMADKQLGLDMNHVSLVIKAQAKLHALSWAYKKHYGLDFISEQFPFLKIQGIEMLNSIWISLMEKGFNIAAETIEKFLGKDSAILNGTLRMKEHMQQMVDEIFNGQFTDKFLPTTNIIGRRYHQEHEAHWRVVIHGDCWTNNLLFRYDERNMKPVDVVFVDLQLMQEHCPTFDIAYLLYTSTTTAFRKQHLNDVLALYYQEFTNICSRVDVEPLSGFTLEELQIRFHRSKPFGFFMAVMALPIMLKDGKDVVDMETVPTDNLTDMFTNIFNSSNRNIIYTERLLSLAQELYDEGVIS